MKTITMLIDTIPFGCKNETKKLNDQMADLLGEKYICLEIVRKISKKDKNHFDNFNLVPTIIDDKIDFILLRKDHYDINDRRIQDAICVINDNYLY